MKYLLGSLALVASAAAHVEKPTLELPWGRWEAKPFENDPQIYKFHNVRFGAKPERFGAPAFPTDYDDSVQEITHNTGCISIDTTKMANPPGGKAPLGEPDEPGISERTEDCLFLDIYAPASAFERGAKLPVVVWIYGGAYAFGSKDAGGSLYTGQSLIQASNYSTIFITGNYRTGAFGWLAGSYMEKAGQPNAGLYDQALLFEWVQRYVSQVGGDKHQVTAWGESAGAGSILHHLIREDGTVDPPFKTFVAQSPAFEWAWDNKSGGRLDRMYQSFSEHTECGRTFDIECLRGLPLSQLVAANQKLFDDVRQTGLFPVGPAVDGKWIKTIPAVAFAEGKVSKKPTSAIISHVANEAKLFTPKIEGEQDLDDFLLEFLPGSTMEQTRKNIKKQYKCHGFTMIPPFLPNWQSCTSQIIRDLSFTCNTRNLFDAFPESSYMMKYSFPTDILAYHASDLIALFSNSKQEVNDMLVKGGLTPDQAKQYSDLLDSRIRKRYQRYFATFAATGNPNPQPAPPASELDHWPKAIGGYDKVQQVRDVALNWFANISDTQNTASACQFWTDIAVNIEKGRSELLPIENPEDPLDL